MGDEPVVGGAAEEPVVAADVPEAPPTPPPSTRRSRSRLALAGSALAGIVGVVLLGVGLLGFASASDDDHSADQARHRRHELHIVEQQAIAETSRIRSVADQLTGDVGKLASASVDMRTAENAIVAAFNAAVGLGNGGNTSGAQAGFAAQAGAVGSLDAKLAAVNAALDALRKDLARVAVKR